MEIGGSAGFTVQARTAALACPKLSCTRTVSWKAPAVFGVPARTPLFPDVVMVRSWVPETSDQVRGGVPPDAVKVCE